MRLKIIDDDAEFSFSTKPPPSAQRIRNFCDRMAYGELVSSAGLLLRLGMCRSTLTHATYFLRDYFFDYRGKKMFGNRRTIAEAKKICADDEKKLTFRKSKRKRN